MTAEEAVEILTRLGVFVTPVIVANAADAEAKTDPENYEDCGT